MSGRTTPATKLVAKIGVQHQLHEYTHDADADSYGLEAATALNMDGDRVFKTLIVKLVSGQLVVAIVPVTKQVNLKAVAAVFQAKSATMAEPTEAERSSGYVVGGISPLGQRKVLSAVIDETVLNYETVLVSGGRRGLMMEIAPLDLIKLCKATPAPISK